MKSLSQLLREARESKRLLLREVAAAINADTAMISKFEKGERKPTREQISLLASALDIEEKEILIVYLSDKIASDLAGEDVAKEALRLAEKKIDNDNRKNSKRWIRNK